MLIRILALLLATSSMAWARELPRLPQTRLFSAVAIGCSDVSLASWQHPVKALLAQKGVIIERVQLCNAGKFPVFHVRFPFDPQGQTEDYFGPLYEGMRKANGGEPYAFVSTTDNTIVSVRYGADGRARPDYEMYR